MNTLPTSRIVQRARSEQLEVRLHLVLTTAYRVAIFEATEIRKCFVKYAAQWATANDVAVEAVGFGPDHVHVLLIPTCSGFTSELVRSLKSNTSRLIRKHHAETIRPYLWGARFWSRGYWQKSVLPSAVSAARRYIEYGQVKHWPPKRSRDVCRRVMPRVERSETLGSSRHQVTDTLNPKGGGTHG